MSGAPFISHPAVAADIFLNGNASDYGGSTLVLDGIIVPGDAQRLVSTIRTFHLPAGFSIFLTSHGGDITESQVLGHVLRHYRAVVRHGYCASACVLTYLGGARRILSDDPGALTQGDGLHIHQPEATAAYLASRNPVIQAAVSQLRTYCNMMTGGFSFYDLMMSIPFETSHTLQRSEAARLGVITE